MEFNQCDAFLGKPLTEVIGTCVLNGYTNVEKVSESEMKLTSPSLKNSLTLRHTDGKVILYGHVADKQTDVSAVKSFTRAELEPFLGKPYHSLKDELIKGGYERNRDEKEDPLFTRTSSDPQITVRFNEEYDVSTPIARIELCKDGKTEIIVPTPFTRAELEPFLGKRSWELANLLETHGFVVDYHDVSTNGYHRTNYKHLVNNKRTGHTILISSRSLMDTTIFQITLQHNSLYVDTIKSKTNTFTADEFKTLLGKTIDEVHGALALRGYTCEINEGEPLYSKGPIKKPYDHSIRFKHHKGIVRSFILYDGVDMIPTKVGTRLTRAQLKPLIGKNYYDVYNYLRVYGYKLAHVLENNTIIFTLCNTDVPNIHVKSTNDIVEAIEVVDV